MMTGFVFLKKIKGKEGLEAIPHLELWKAIPGLVKDGFLFLIRGFKGSSSYSQVR